VRDAVALVARELMEAGGGDQRRNRLELGEIALEA
jgi:hypothetical protein